MSGFAKVLDVLDNYKSAIYEQDVEKFIASYAPEVHIYDCWGNWEYIGVSQWKESINGWFNDLSEEGSTVKTDFDDVVVEENANLAFVHCSITYVEYNASGEKFRSMTNRFTFCLRKENESWLITHEHSSLPINMETGKGIFNLK